MTHDPGGKGKREGDLFYYTRNETYIITLLLLRLKKKEPVYFISGGSLFVSDT